MSEIKQDFHKLRRKPQTIFVIKREVVRNESG